MAGGRLCGAVRFEVDAAAPDYVSVCHCRMCQRMSGQPVGIAAIFRTSAVRMVAGSPREYHSSESASRWFCGDCGSPLWFEPRPGNTREIWVGVLDDPHRFPPGRHIWTESRVHWFDTADALPRRPGAW